MGLILTVVCCLEFVSGMVQLLSVSRINATLEISETPNFVEVDESQAAYK